MSEKNGKPNRTAPATAAAAGTTHDPGKPKKPVVTVIPDFVDKDGELKKLKSKMFPKTKEGKMAYCDYQIKRWEVKKVAVEKGTDPLEKKKRRIEKLKKTLAILDEEVAAEEKTAASDGK